MAQVAALVREGMLEELLAGEILEIRVMDPTLAHTLIGWPINVLEQQKPDHETGLYSRSAMLAVERRDLAVDPVPIDLAGEQYQLVLRLMIWSSRARNRSFDPVVWCFFGRIVPSDAEKESCFPLRGNPKAKLQGSDTQSVKTLQS